MRTWPVRVYEKVDDLLWIRVKLSYALAFVR